jgi:hypothetical protein
VRGASGHSVYTFACLTLGRGDRVVAGAPASALVAAFGLTACSSDETSSDPNASEGEILVLTQRTGSR